VALAWSKLRAMPASSPIASAVSVIGLSDFCMGMIRAAIRTEVRLPECPASYDAGLDDVVCRQSQLVIIGVDDNRVQAMELSQALVKEHEGIRLIAISEQEHRYGVLDAMRAGFSEYLLLPEEAETLRRSIHKREHVAGTQHLGKLVAILGTKGGCGVSTITVHLAAQLASMYRVCAVDMDFGMGDVAALLSLEPETSIHELLAKPQLTQREILRSVSVHHSHVHVLPQPSFLVLNRWREGAPLSISDIEEHLGIPVARRIHEDRTSVEQAATRGVLIREINAHSPVHLDIARSASLIAD
jgi:Flp pilus assembly CpaE family ATPase